MSGKQIKLLCIFCFINFAFFIYYFLLPDINPTNDTFYYMSIADSFYKGTGFNDITQVEPNPVITPQNGIVFVHTLLLWSGLHDPGSRLLAIKLINYLGFLCIIFIFYIIFKRLKISPEITLLCLGIILLSAHFLKTVLAPINDGACCVLTCLAFYAIFSNDTENSLSKITIISFLSIMLANFRLNGPLIVLSAGLSYLYLKQIKISLIYLTVFFISYASVFALLWLLHIDLSGIKSIVTSAYNLDFFFNQIVLTLNYTIPGVIVGISGRSLFMAVPISLIVLAFFIIYLRQSMREGSFIKILTGIFIILTIVFLIITPGWDSRYIIMIVPFSLLAIATYFKDNVKLRTLLWISLIAIFLISLFRVILWDSIFFTNKKCLEYIQRNLKKPFILISQSSRISYYVFNERCSNSDDIKKGSGNIVIFGNENYIKSTIDTIRNEFKIKNIENINKQIIVGHREEDRYGIVRLFVE